MSEGLILVNAAVLGADVDEEEVARAEAVPPLIGAAVPGYPVADVHGTLLGADSAGQMNESSSNPR